MSTKRHYLALVTILLLAPAGWAQSVQSRIEAIIGNANLGDAKCSVAVVELRNGIPVAEYHADESMIPASNMKLVTSAAALGILGADFQFSTRLELHGDALVVVGDGDPAFGDPELLEQMGMNVEDLLSRWVDSAKRAGITRVGSLVIDDRAFDDQRIHPNWPEDQLHRWYCAQVAGLNFNNNVLDIYAAPTRPGQTPSIRVMPADPPVVFTNAAKTGPRNAFYADRRMGTNQITLRGQVPHRMLKPIHVTVDDPAMVFGGVLRDRLQDAGIAVGVLRRAGDEDRFERGALIAEVLTPIDRVLARCNKDSQNLFAEALIKRVGREATGDPGAWSSGAAAQRMFLSRLLGPQAAGFVIDDGSGMSRDNRVSASLLTAVLTEMHRKPQLGKVYRQSLSVGGKDGSLRLRFRGKRFASTVHGKSGYIDQVVTLSGYIRHDETDYAFSILLNDYTGMPFRGRRLIDRIVGSIDDYLAGRRMDLATMQTQG